MRRFAQHLTLAWAALAGAAAVAEPAPPLRMAQTEGMGYPLVMLSPLGKVDGGFLKELGDRIAAMLGTHAEHPLFTRRRIVQAVLSGQADIACYYSPLWVREPSAHWSVPVVPQVERVVSPAGRAIDYHEPGDLAGKRVAVLLGYHFPELQPMFDAGRTKRVDDTKVESLFRRVGQGMADALVTSESEIEGYFKRRPAERAKFAVSSRTFSIVDTQCLLSPHSPWPDEAVNKALTGLLGSGEIARMAQRYGLSMR